MNDYNKIYDILEKFIKLFNDENKHTRECAVKCTVEIVKKIDDYNKLYEILEKIIKL